jgi:hypothetical protein
MTEFALAGLHPTFERPVVDTLRGLSLDYPLVELRRVLLFERPGDNSIAHASVPGEIALNARWFGRPIEELRTAARERHIIRLGELALAWHGDMEEPHHVLAHEFGHCLQDALPAWEAFAITHWRAACRDPVGCRPVSGYALAGPDEWWADTFAALRNHIECESTRLLGEMLRGVGV